MNEITYTRRETQRQQTHAQACARTSGSKQRESDLNRDNRLQDLSNERATLIESTDNTTKCNKKQTKTNKKNKTGSSANAHLVLANAITALVPHAVNVKLKLVNDVSGG